MDKALSGAADALASRTDVDADEVVDADVESAGAADAGCFASPFIISTGRMALTFLTAKSVMLSFETKPYPSIILSARII